MKSKLLIILFTIFLYCAWNSNYFQATFFPQKFFAYIFDSDFDTTIAGNSISIPLKHKYNTKYEVYLSIPFDSESEDIMFHMPPQKGFCSYQFISDGKIIKEGQTHQLSWKHTVLNSEYSAVSILSFDLPYPEAGNNLTLKLTVEEPMDFLSRYSGQIKCFVKPDSRIK